jgi:DNA polymerase I-like protein with 3'-5' exonuclease and polymerase domains
MGEHGLRAWGEHFNFPKGECDYDAGWCEEMKKYLHKDTELTWKVFEHLFPKVIGDEALKKCYYNIDLPFTRQIIELNHNGVLINRGGWQEVIDELKPLLDEVNTKIVELYPLVPSKKVTTKNERNPDTTCTEFNLGLGKFVFVSKDDNGYTYKKVEPFNPNSTDHVAYALKSLYNWVPEKFSEKTGKPQVTSDILEELGYPLAELLTEQSKLDKLVSTYGEALLEKVSDDGRMRASFNNCITLTGRLSSSSPNLQNIPSKGETGDKLRSLFVAPEGRKLVGIDIDAFQMRIFAWYLHTFCNDDNLFNEFNTNDDADPHTVTANLIGVERKVGKTINFGSIFGIGAAKMSNSLKIPETQAKGYLDKLRQAFPAFFNVKETVWKRARENRGNVYTLYGRKGYYPDIVSNDKSKSSRAERQAFNFIVQGTEADLIKIWCNTTYKFIQEHSLDAKLILQVHDEVLYETSEEDAPKLVAYLNWLINGYDWLPELRLKATANVGTTWHDVH